MFRSENDRLAASLDSKEFLSACILDCNVRHIMASPAQPTISMNALTDERTQPAQLESGTITPSNPSIDDKPISPPMSTFPEGGARAWCVAAGHGGVAFCTFGYVNSFG